MEKKKKKKKKKKKNSEEQDFWIQLIFIPGTTFSQLSYLGREGILVAANQTSISVFTKWINLVSEPDKSVSNYMDNLISLNDPLPGYHPKLLIENLLWGNFALVQKFESFFIFC